MATMELQRREAPSLSAIKERFGGIIWEEVHTCYSKLPKGARTIYSLEDIFSETLLVICERYNQYDPERGAETTFISTVVRNKLSNLVRAQYTQEKGEGEIILSMDGTGEDDGSFEIMQSKMRVSTIDETGIFLYDISKGDPDIAVIAQGLMDGEDFWKLKQKTNLPTLLFNQKLDSLQSQVANLFGIVYNEFAYDLNHGHTESNPKTEDEQQMVPTVVPKKVIPKKVLPARAPANEEESDSRETAGATAPKAKAIPQKKGTAKKVPPKKAGGEKVRRSAVRKDGDIMKDLDPGALTIAEELLDHISKKYPAAVAEKYHDRICWEVPGKSKGSTKRIGCLLKSKKASTIQFHMRYLDTKDQAQGPNHKEVKEMGLDFKRGAHSDFVDVTTKKEVAAVKQAIKLRVAAITPE